MSVPALNRGIAILKLFRRGRRALSAPEIANELAIPRSTVHRLLVELAALGLVRREGEGRFALDAGVLTLGYEYLAGADLAPLAEPLLERLRDETNWSAHLGVRQGRDVIYLSRCPSRAALQRNVGVGSVLPARQTLMGRILLSDLEPTELRALYADDEDRLSEAQIHELQHLIEDDLKRGFVADTGYFEAGVQAVAAPVHDGSLKIVAAINAAAPIGQSDVGVAKAVCAAAETLSRMLGAPENIHQTAPIAPGETVWR